MFESMKVSNAGFIVTFSNYSFSETKVKWTKVYL